MPKEPEATSSAPGDIPGSQSGSHDSSQEQTMPKHSTESNTDDVKGKEFDHHDAPSPAGKEKDDLSPIPDKLDSCLLYTSPSPRDRTRSRMPSSA